MHSAAPGKSPGCVAERARTRVCPISFQGPQRTRAKKGLGTKITRWNQAAHAAVATGEIRALGTVVPEVSHVVAFGVSGRAGDRQAINFQFSRMHRQ